MKKKRNKIRLRYNTQVIRRFCVSFDRQNDESSPYIDRPHITYNYMIVRSFHKRTTKYFIIFCELLSHVNIVKRFHSQYTDICPLNSFHSDKKTYRLLQQSLSEISTPRSIFTHVEKLEHNV